MHRTHHTPALCLLVLVLWIGGAAYTAEYPPADHGGYDFYLAPGDVVWGLHTNIRRFWIPPNTEVTVRGYVQSSGQGLTTPNLQDVPDVGIGSNDLLSQTTDVGSGMLEIHADEILIEGTLNARGKGYWGGAGGGAGGGASVYGFTGSLMPGHGGLGGSGMGMAAGGNNGADGQGAFANGAAGGDGGSGGSGAGPAGGRAGIPGRGAFSSPGTSGGAGSPGGYFLPGINGDESTDMDVRLGSGGGGGGGGAG
ncbi:MAG: hypothetical protein N3D11_08140, partial [Candidatus Sumerlaeia bacterium]|nr:hypothetical protein [Candidatus Sumerlaeia bacterium]